jgi:ABC-type transport system involved in multi-copper enzyme maturation permease subunit
VSSLVASELLKQRSTRTSPLLVAWMTGLILLLILLHVFSLGHDEMSGRAGQLKVIGWGTSIGALFASLLGAMSMTAEIRHGTIRPTFLATPRRERVIAAKLLAGAFTGLGVGVIAEGLAAAIEAAGLSVRGLQIQLTASDYVQLIVGGAAVGALFAAVGVGVGAIVRHQVSTIAGLCVWLLLIETTLIGNVPSAGKFTPGAAAGAIAGAVQTQSASKLVAPGIGVLLLAGYAAVAAVAGAVLTIRRDVA